MSIKLKLVASASVKEPVVFSGNKVPLPLAQNITVETEKALKAKFQEGQKFRVIHGEDLIIYQGSPLDKTKNPNEQYRQLGAQARDELFRNRINEVQVFGDGALDISFGIASSDYRFELYKKQPESFFVKRISIDKSAVSKEEIAELEGLVEAISFARDLVNEPHNTLTAKEMARRFANAGKHANYDVEILGKSRIKSLKMGGLLSVNQGSTQEPSFSIIEYAPENAKSEQPIILVGKGIVYDTGGLSLKPTPNSMDIMKCDMGGAAAVAGAIHAAALNKLPLRIIGLVPATDNQPGPDAYGPGDVITMYDGTRVEVMNTDAEGRLVLADALSYAKQFSPELVIDLATLTGSSMRAIGNYAAALMGTAKDKEIKQLIQAGFDSHERLVEFPLWEDYSSDLHSDIADTKNLGPTPMADVIIAGKFLQRFTDFPWMHIDIAGPAFLPSKRGYLPKGGTGFGVHLLYTFLKQRAHAK